MGQHCVVGRVQSCLSIAELALAPALFILFSDLQELFTFTASSGPDTHFLGLSSSDQSDE